MLFEAMNEWTNKSDLRRLRSHLSFAWMAQRTLRD
jgi:hypothetical protein